MTLRIHAPNPMRVGETKNVIVTSDNPGVVSLVYGAGLTGPATATIEGTREYRLDGRGGDYLAIPNFAQSRGDVTFLFVVDWDRIVGSRTSVAALITQGGLIGSWRVDAPALCNWSIHARRYTSSGSASAISIIYAQSATNAISVAAAVTYNNASGYTPNSGPERWAITKSAAGVINLHRAVRGVIATATVATTGTMGGAEALIMQGGQACSKILRVCDNAELDAWFSAGTIPATNQEFSYLGNHEITDTPKVWDSTGTNDLYAYQVPLWQTPGMSVRNVDSSPVTPYALVPVTAVGTTDTTIDATRPRQGVPARASEAEKTETADQVTVTVNPAELAIGPDLNSTAARFPTRRQFTVYSQTDGAVTLASDNAKVLVPASVVVVDGFAVFDVSISGAVSGVTITATQGAATATCSVAVALASPAVPEMAANDTLQLFPEWLWTEPHAQGISAVMDDRRTAFVSDLDHLLIYDFANQTSAMLDLVAEMFAIYGWNKAAGTTEKVAFLESSLKILRKSGTHYAVKEAIRLVCDAAKIESITILPGAGNLYDGENDFDGSINFDSLFHWAKFDVEIETTDAAYFTDEIKAIITAMINHYKPASRWFESLIITEI